MKRLLAALAVLCFANVLSAQVVESPVESLAKTLDAFHRIPPGTISTDSERAVPFKLQPSTEACTTYLLPYAGVAGGKDLWGVVNRAQPNANSCYITNNEPWDYWSVPVKAGEQITFAIETTVRTYISIETGSVYSGISALQPNGKYLTGYIWNVPANYSKTTATVAVSPYGTSNVYTLSVGKPVTSGCIAGASNLCLNGGRFKVQATYNTGTTTGTANASSMTSDTGYFWFFAASNVEVLVKIVDGRGVNGKFWVFAGGLTNVDVLITITDTETGAVKTYRNPANTAFAPIQDTNAF